MPIPRARPRSRGFPDPRPMSERSHRSRSTFRPSARADAARPRSSRPRRRAAPRTCDPAGRSCPRDRDRPAQRIVVVGASAGGVEALIELSKGLPADFPAPIFVTIHVPSDAPSILPVILKRNGKLDAKHAQDGMAFKAGVIYIAPPDHHMLIQRNGTLRVVRGPRENRHRPAIDPLFRSAAIAVGPAVIGVILTGTLDDGTAGLIAIKECGGTAIVQDPADALYSPM